VRTNGQVGTGQASGDGLVLPREQGGTSKGSEAVTGACGIILLPREKEEITVCIERSPQRWPGMLGGGVPPLVINSEVLVAILDREIEPDLQIDELWRCREGPGRVIGQKSNR